jgi:hypothetical protein
MSIKKYTNIESINNKLSNEGQFLQTDDSFIVTKSELEASDFGNCKYDIMEVSIYDINNNLLPQKTLENVAYIKSDDIKNYMYKITNKSGQTELAIDVEKLLKNLGYSNGILKVNINFVRQRVGSDNELERVWIEEISPSREEIRILPLKTKFENINNKTKTEFKNLQDLNKEFKYSKSSLLNVINSFQNTFLEKIDSALESKYGKDFFTVIKKDFGLSNFGKIRTKIFVDFKTSMDYYLNNKNYDISQSNFGKNSEIRFNECDSYDFNKMMNDIQSILYKSVDFNLQSLKRRDISLKTLPKEFAITELQKLIQNNLDSFSTYSETKRNVYSPDGTAVVFNDVTSSFVEPTYPLRGTLLNTLCKGYDQYGVYADGNGGTYEELIETNSTICGYTPPPPPEEGGGGSGGGGGGSTGGGGNPNDGPERIDGGTGRAENFR